MYLGNEVFVFLLQAVGFIGSCDVWIFGDSVDLPLNIAPSQFPIEITKRKTLESRRKAMGFGVRCQV